MVAGSEEVEEKNITTVGLLRSCDGVDSAGFKGDSVRSVAWSDGGVQEI